MPKEHVRAGELAHLIETNIGVAGVEIAVRRDHAFGWVPTVLSAPSDSIGFQRQAEEIAHKLRVRFDLME